MGCPPDSPPTQKKTIQNKNIVNNEDYVFDVKVDYIDLIQVHDVEFAESLAQLVQHTIPALIQLKSQG